MAKLWAVTGAASLKAAAQKTMRGRAQRTSPLTHRATTAREAVRLPTTRARLFAPVDAAKLSGGACHKCYGRSAQGERHVRLPPIAFDHNAVSGKGQNCISGLLGVEHAFQIQTMNTGDNSIIAVMVVTVEPELN